MTDLRHMTDAEVEAACLVALEAIDARQRQTKMLNRPDTGPRYYYKETFRGLELLSTVVEAFAQAHKDLGIPVETLCRFKFVEQVSEEEYKATRLYAREHPQPVQGWLDVRDNTIVLVVDGPDIQRTALHEAYHLYQELNGIGRYASAENEQAAEAYCQKACPDKRLVPGEEKQRALYDYALRQMIARGEV